MEGFASHEYAILYIEQNKIYKIILHNNIITKLHLYQSYCLCTLTDVDKPMQIRMERGTILLF